MPDRVPSWLIKRITHNEQTAAVTTALARSSVRTVCTSALCPNRSECFSRKTATFMVLGAACTRRCSFCSVMKGPPEPVDPTEGAAIAAIAGEWGLRHVVITSVTRDDLADGGAAHIAGVARTVRERLGAVTIELLVPDFGGDTTAIVAASTSGVDVFGHNIETVPRLYGTVRPLARYTRSLEVLRRAKAAAPAVTTKSGMMVGLGESEDEVIRAMEDIRRTGCDMITIGQYLRPRAGNLPVDRHVPPEEFDRYRAAGEAYGFRSVLAGPFVRSSYRADETYATLTKEG